MATRKHQGLLDCEVLEPLRPACGSMIWLHGLGADGYDFMPFGKQLSVCHRHALRFICPHAPRRRITINDRQLMRAWFDVAALTEDAFQDKAGIEQSAAMVNALIDHEIESGIEPSRIVLGGFSQGGMMALHCGLRYPDALGGVMCLSGALLLSDELASMRHESNLACPIFLAHGRRDPILPLAFGERAQSKLEALGYAPQWHAYDMEHQVCTQEMHDCDAWLDQLYG